MKKVYVSWHDVQRQVQEIVRQMHLDGWMPDYIVGLTRGGLTPANLLSQYLNIPMHTLKVSLRDDANPPESNLWMAEDAFGSNEFDGKKILIVDDINDSGDTLTWIKQDWQSSCLPNDERWNDIWSNNVRFAVLINNEASKFRDPDYIGKMINKYENPEWCVFPWENWWE